jgi:hypothetical protein
VPTRALLQTRYTYFEFSPRIHREEPTSLVSLWPRIVQGVICGVKKWLTSKAVKGDRPTGQGRALLRRLLLQICNICALHPIAPSVVHRSTRTHGRSMEVVSASTTENSPAPVPAHMGNVRCPLGHGYRVSVVEQPRLRPRLLGRLPKLKLKLKLKKSQKTQPRAR